MTDKDLQRKAAKYANNRAKQGSNSWKESFEAYIDGYKANKCNCNDVIGDLREGWAIRKLK